MQFHGRTIKVEALLREWGLRRTNVSGDEYICACPLHNDRTPSFSVNLRTGLYNCFVCGGGDIVDLTMKVEGFPSRDETILRLLGVAKKSDRGAQVQVIQDTLQEIMQPEVTHSDSNDLEYPRPLSAIEETDYLMSRGFRRMTCERFDARYDKQTRCIVLPVRDSQERVVNHVMRTTQKDTRPKYRYVPGVSKHGQWFGLEPFDRSSREAIIVEGPLDVMWVWQAGFQVLGLMGSRLDQDQVNTLHYLGIRQVTLHLDNDKAGYQGTLYARHLLLGKFVVNVAGYPEPFQDPCDLTRKELEYVYKNVVPMHVLETERGI